MESVAASLQSPSSQHSTSLASVSKKRKRDDEDNGDTIAQKTVHGVDTIHNVWEVLKT